MTLPQLQVALCAFIDANPAYFPIDYEDQFYDEAHVLQHRQIEITPLLSKDMLIAQLVKSNNEMQAYCPLGTAIWCQAFALILEIHNDRHINPNDKRAYVKNFIAQIVEGMITEGGCIQGFVNRGFVVLTRTLGNLAGIMDLPK
jgi:hypothetical protein